jgi:hypothetical protein
MPDPKKYKDKDSFMKICIPMVLKEGTAKSNDQAVAVCSSMWENRGKKKKTKASVIEELRTIIKEI